MHGNSWLTKPSNKYRPELSIPEKKRFSASLKVGWNRITERLANLLIVGIYNPSVAQTADGANTSCSGHSRILAATSESSHEPTTRPGGTWEVILMFKHDDSHARTHRALWPLRDMYAPDILLHTWWGGKIGQHKCTNCNNYPWAKQVAVGGWKTNTGKFCQMSMDSLNIGWLHLTRFSLRHFLKSRKAVASIWFNNKASGSPKNPKSTKRNLKIAN